MLHVYVAVSVLIDINIFVVAALTVYCLTLLKLDYRCIETADFTYFHQILTHLHTKLYTVETLHHEHLLTNCTDR